MKTYEVDLKIQVPFYATIRFRAAFLEAAREKMREWWADYDLDAPPIEEPMLLPYREVVECLAQDSPPYTTLQKVVVREVEDGG